MFSKLTVTIKSRELGKDVALEKFKGPKIF